MNVAVIGSGISGISAAHALVARGVKVTILDVGEYLDEPRQTLLKKLHNQVPTKWNENFANLLFKNDSFGSKNILPKKMHFGSDYIYAKDRPFSKLVTNTDGRVPYPNFALGGFSNIWGAASLPIDSCDMVDWPFSRSELEPYFIKVGQIIPLCGGEGNLSDSFPTYHDQLGTLDIGPQGMALMEDLDRVRVHLKSRNTIFGKSRLAVHTHEAYGDVLPCNGCGNCFTGCIRKSIFSTLPILDELVRSKKVVYRAGFFVDSIDEKNSKVYIKGKETKFNNEIELVFDAVFVGAGPINTTRMLLRSKNIYDQILLLKESQKFVMPMLRLRGADTNIDYQAPTLASVFLETKVPTISDHWIHAQIISMNELIIKAANLPGTKHSFGKYLWNPLLRHMMVGWFGMHSDHSSQVELKLRQGSGGGSNSLELGLRVSNLARATAVKAAKEVFRTGLSFDTIFLYKMIKFSNPGSGTHCGSSFPMKATPTERFDSDVLGRPFGWSKVFIVDSSALPSIPGTTLAYTVMANAYRVASTALLG